MALSPYIDKYIYNYNMKDVEFCEYFFVILDWTGYDFYSSRRLFFLGCYSLILLGDLGPGTDSYGSVLVPNSSNLPFVFIFCLQGEMTTEILVVVMDIQVVCLGHMVDVGVVEARIIIIEGIT